MVYVHKDSSGNIDGVFVCKQDDLELVEMADSNSEVVAYLNLSQPITVLSQDMLKQLTVADMTAIQSAISTDAGKALLWYALLAQRDPMAITNDRFLLGWNTLKSILGAQRMLTIATALGVTIN